MKKIALMLAALTAVSAVASAKEVVQAPVLVEEVVVIAPVAKWRPSGFVDLSYKYYGQDEYDSADFGRVQLEGKVELSENDRLEFRGRRYNTYKTQANLSALEESQQIGSFGDASELRLRYFYENGMIGDTKIGLTQRVQYENKQSLGKSLNGALDNDGNPIQAADFGGKYQSAEYRMIFEFSEYMSWTPEWFKNTSATIQPYYNYGWTDSDAGHSNELGFQLGSYFELPAGFGFEFNLYPTWISENGGDLNWSLAYEAYLYYGYNLYKDGNISLDFNFEGGMDPYIFKTDSTDAEYSAYAMPSVELSYQRNEFLKLYAGVAGEYRNWRDTNKDTARNWDWMPQAYAGFRVNF